MGMADLWNNFLRKKCFFVRLWSAFYSDNLSLNPQFLKNLAYFLLIKFPNGGAMCQNLDVEANCIYEKGPFWLPRGINLKWQLKLPLMWRTFGPFSHLCFDLFRPHKYLRKKVKSAWLTAVGKFNLVVSASLLRHFRCDRFFLILV